MGTQESRNWGEGTPLHPCKTVMAERTGDTGQFLWQKVSILSWSVKHQGRCPGGDAT